MTNFYRKMIEPIMDKDADELRRAAWILENYKSDNDTNLSTEARLSLAEVSNRVARLKDFAGWIFSDELGKELEEYDKEN